MREYEEGQVPQFTWTIEQEQEWETWVEKNCPGMTLRDVMRGDPYTPECGAYEFTRDLLDKPYSVVASLRASQMIFDKQRGKTLKNNLRFTLERNHAPGGPSRAFTFWAATQLPEQAVEALRELGFADQYVHGMTKVERWQLYDACEHLLSDAEAKALVRDLEKRDAGINVEGRIK